MPLYLHLHMIEQERLSKSTFGSKNPRFLESHKFVSYLFNQDLGNIEDYTKCNTSVLHETFFGMITATYYNTEHRSILRKIVQVRNVSYR